MRKKKRGGWNSPNLRERGREGSPEIFLLEICFRPQKAEKNKKFS
jgi:hypothetical protein